MWLGRCYPPTKKEKRVFQGRTAPVPHPLLFICYAAANPHVDYRTVLSLLALTINAHSQDTCSPLINTSCLKMIAQTMLSLYRFIWYPKISTKMGTFYWNAECLTCSNIWDTPIEETRPTKTYIHVAHGYWTVVPRSTQPKLVIIKRFWEVRRTKLKLGLYPLHALGLNLLRGRVEGVGEEIWHAQPPAFWDLHGILRVVHKWRHVSVADFYLPSPRHKS